MKLSQRQAHTRAISTYGAAVLADLWPGNSYVREI